jgi:hypothetical protein
VELEIDVMRSSDIVAALQEKTATAGLSPATAAPGAAAVPAPALCVFCGKHHALFGQHQSDLQRENFVSFTSDQIGGMLAADHLP